MSSFRRALAIPLLLAVSLGGRAAADSTRDPLAVAAPLDREVDAALAAAGVPASPPADDAEFLRRVCLDVTGRIPTRERATAFLDSTDPDRRRRLIDELLASRDYAQHFATVWRNRLA